jgi:hypothetical protein
MDENRQPYHAPFLRRFPESTCPSCARFLRPAQDWNVAKMDETQHDLVAVCPACGAKYGLWVIEGKEVLSRHYRTGVESDYRQARFDLEFSRLKSESLSQELHGWNLSYALVLAGVLAAGIVLIIVFQFGVALSDPPPSVSAVLPNTLGCIWVALLIPALYWSALYAYLQSLVPWRDRWFFPFMSKAACMVIMVLFGVLLGSAWWDFMIGTMASHPLFWRVDNPYRLVITGYVFILPLLHIVSYIQYRRLQLKQRLAAVHAAISGVETFLGTMP